MRRTSKEALVVRCVDDLRRMLRVVFGVVLALDRCGAASDLCVEVCGEPLPVLLGEELHRPAVAESGPANVRAVLVERLAREGGREAALVGLPAVVPSSSTAANGADP